MHSTIIQLETNHMSESERLSANEMRTNDEYDWFFVSVSDGVAETENPEEYVEDFIKLLQYFGDIEVGSDDKGRWIVFKEGFKRSYFEKIYPHFEEALKEIVEKRTLMHFADVRLLGFSIP